MSNMTPSGITSGNTVWGRALALCDAFTHGLNSLQAPASLLARGYVAYAFFLSGLTKLRDWDITLLLFTEDYQVPFLPPAVAAVLGTGGELLFPLLLVLGLGGRVAALGLTAINIVAVLSYPDISAAALQQHVTWGVLLGALALYGAGKWALDPFLQSQVRSYAGRSMG
jgi:putative oxidoreductase